MKKTCLLSILFLMLCMTSVADAVTIRNKCSFPLAGSIKVISTGVALHQFRLIPDGKVHLNHRLPNKKMILRVVPDIRNMNLIKLEKVVLNSPDCYIEVKVKKGKLSISVD